MTNRQIVIAELPKDALTADHFKQTTADMPKEIGRAHV